MVPAYGDDSNSIQGAHHFLSLDKNFLGYIHESKAARRLAIICTNEKHKVPAFW